MALKILSVAGARPSLIKVLAISEAVKKINSQFQEEQLKHLLVQVCADPDRSGSDLFNDLELPKPDVCLKVNSASHSIELAKSMELLELIFFSERPHVVLTFGNSNYSLASALVAKKIWCAGNRGAEPFIPKVAHVEGE